MVELKNGDKLKEFRLNMISDQRCTQEEMDKFIKDNKKIQINSEFISQIRQQFVEATKF